MTPDHAILLCLLAPFVGALAAFALKSRRHVALGVGLLALGLALAAALVLVGHTRGGAVHAIHVGEWPAPFGIVLVADGFSSLMLVVCLLVVIAALASAALSLPPRFFRRPLVPMVLLLATGTCGAFLTGDLFNLYVWFEVLLLSSFALMSMLPGRPARRGTWSYVVINLVSSMLFLGAAGLIYGKTGTLNFADLQVRLADAESPFLIESSSALLFGAFAIKAALLPLAFWLPASYPLLPPALGALFAGLLTKVGLYALYRLAAGVLAQGAEFPHRELLLAVALVTMLGGVLGAVGQGGMRSILSYHIISQVGYMALALALFTPLAIAAGIFYLVHHIVVKANLFLVAGLVERLDGTSRLERAGGLLHRAPLVALLFAIPALSLAGLPPLSGFFAKFGLLRASLEAGEPLAAVTVVAVGLLTLFSMLKIWRGAFWGDHDASAREARPVAGLIAISATLAAVTVAIGLGAGPVFTLAEEAAASLLDHAAYHEAVLGPEQNPRLP